MKLKLLIALVTIGAAFDWQAEAQTYDTNGVVVQTFAGSGFSGYVDGVGQQTMFNRPYQVVADSHGNLFVWDDGNNRIRKIAPDATVTTFAGGGNQVTGVGTNVGLASSFFGSLTIDRDDTIWLVLHPGGSPALYKITSAAVVTSTNLPGVVFCYGICADSFGNLYISSSYTHRIFVYTTNGVLSVFAGSGNDGYADGNGLFTAFSGPETLVADAANNIYVWDSGNRLIRRIDQSQNVTTFAGNGSGSNVDGVGTNAAFYSVSAMCVDNSGNIYLADYHHVFGSAGSSIRRMTAATNVLTMAGSFSQTGYTNGTGNVARFSGASGVCISGGTIYVADSGNQRIRSIMNNPTNQPVLPANLQLSTYPGLRIVGTVGRTYQVQSSPDMTNWTTRATLLLNSSPYLWIDQNPVSGNTFYRVLLLP